MLGVVPIDWDTLTRRFQGCTEDREPLAELALL